MSVLVIVEHDNQNLSPNLKNVLQAALELDSAPVLLVAGHNCSEIAKQAASMSGVAKVLLADAPCYAHMLAEDISKLVQHLAADFSHILTISNTFGKNILPRVAALLDCTQVTDVTQIIDHATFIHPIYAGNALEKVRVLSPKKLLTIRATAFDAVENQQPPCTIESTDFIVSTNNSKFISAKVDKPDRPELNSAAIIVSGGRGLQSAEQFKLVEELADCLGAAVGASRAAVDAGFVPNDYQVGQTGKIVAPNLYIALGISGAIQHLAGMQDSKIIVAINTDADAPIFQIASYGLVGDVFEVVPSLIEELKNRGIAKC